MDKFAKKWEKMSLKVCQIAYQIFFRKKTPKKRIFLALFFVLQKSRLILLPKIVQKVTKIAKWHKILKSDHADLGQKTKKCSLGCFLGYFCALFFKKWEHIFVKKWVPLFKRTGA